MFRTGSVQNITDLHVNYIYQTPGKSIHIGFVLEIDDCLLANCNAGTCIDGANTFTCDCDAGWEGTLCNEGNVQA